MLHEEAEFKENGRNTGAKSKMKIQRGRQRNVLSVEKQLLLQEYIAKSKASTVVWQQEVYS